MDLKNYIVLICARGGSKGLPGKNIKPLNGIPLIAWSILSGKKINRAQRVVVSTDSKAIAEIALEYGAEVPFMRPKELALDDTPEWDVWRHAIDFLEIQDNNKFDAIVVLPATSPLRSEEDINRCINLFERGGVDSVITVSESNRSPYFNMVHNDKDGFSSIVIPSKKNIYRRQDVSKTFDMTTVCYVVKKEFIKKYHNIFEGKVKSICIPKERAVDIDDSFDFKIAEYLINSN